jgi:hypothetical protein
MKKKCSSWYKDSDPDPDPDPVPYIKITDPDPGGPKTYGSATLPNKNEVVIL